MTKISVVIPAYNRAKLVGRAIQSVLDQTLPAHEILVVDDCSTDETREVLRSWSELDARVRPVFQDRNGGPAGARNRGVAEASGNLIAFLDSDDAWRPDHLAECAAFLSDRPELDLVFADLRRLVDEAQVLHTVYLWEGKQIGRYLNREPVGDERFTFRLPEAQVLMDQYVVPVQTTVIRADVARRFPFDPSIRGPEDYDFFMRVARAGARFGYVNRVHCDCFIHESNLLSNGRSALRECVESLKVWKKLLGGPLQSKERQVVKSRLAGLRLDEGYGRFRNGERRAAIIAYLASLKMRPSWRALKGLAVAAICPTSWTSASRLKPGDSRIPERPMSRIART